MKVIIGLSLLFLLPGIVFAGSGDLSSVDEPIVPEQDSFLFIYRPFSNYLRVSKWEFLVDKERSITLTNGTYAKLCITPGKHEIVSGMSKKISQPPLLLVIEAVEGKNVYVKYEMRLQGNILMNLIDSPKFNNRLYEVEESQALTELKELTATTMPERRRQRRPHNE